MELNAKVERGPLSELSWITAADPRLWSLHEGETVRMSEREESDERGAHEQRAERRDARHEVLVLREGRMRDLP